MTRKLSPGSPNHAAHNTQQLTLTSDIDTLSIWHLEIEAVVKSKQFYLFVWFKTFHNELVANAWEEQEGRKSTSIERLL